MVLLDSIRPIALAKSVRHAPHAALRVATHAVFAEQRRGIPHSAVGCDVPRPVDQPRIDFGEVVVDSLAHGLHGIVVRGWVEEPYLHFVVRLVRLDAKVIRLAGFDLPGDESTERAVLLVGTFVKSAALFVGVNRYRAGYDFRGRMHVGNGIEVREVVAIGDVSLAEFLIARHAFLVKADPRARHGFHDLQVGADVLRLAALVFNPIPIVRSRPDASVVVVLEVVRPADYVDHLNSRTLLERNVCRLLGSVVRLGLQDQRSMRERLDWTQLNRHGNIRHRRGRRWQRGGRRGEARVVGYLADRLGPIRNCDESQRVPAGLRCLIHHADIRIEGVKDLAPIDCGCDTRVAAVAAKARFR